MKTKIYIPLFITLISLTSYAQRLRTSNSLGWYQTIATVNVSKSNSIWLEYNWRRDNIITNWQQSLARMGVQHSFKNNASVAVGYAYILSYPYSDYPAGPHHVPEHRFFEQLMWGNNIGRLMVLNRVRLEQRFTGKVDQTVHDYSVNGWTYRNRVRFQVRATLPINKKKLENKTWYVAGYDELFIGFGKNVNQNIYDQNRCGLLCGYQLNNTVRIEGGYFNQTAQQSNLVAGKEVFQYNNGIIINTFINVN